MPERREGLDPNRAAELEEILERQFEIAGLGKAEVHAGLSAMQIIDRDLKEVDAGGQSTDIAGIINSYCDARGVDPQLRGQIAVVCGELFGAGDLSGIKARLDRSELPRKADRAMHFISDVALGK